MNINKLLRVSVICILLAVGFVYADEQSGRPKTLIGKQTELERFYKKFELPQEVKSVFDAHADEIFSYKCLFGRFKYAEEFFLKEKFFFYQDDFKRPLSRLINSTRMSQCIDDLGLTHVAVPKKYLYKHGDKLCTVVQTIKTTQFAPLTLDELIDLMTLTYQTGYSDWHTGNICRNSADGKIVVLDTEDFSFNSSNQNFYDKFHRVLGLLQPFRKFMTLEALACIDKYDETCSLLEKCSRDFNLNLLLSNNQEYDKTIGIDFEQVKQECLAAVVYKAKL